MLESIKRKFRDDIFNIKLDDISYISSKCPEERMAIYRGTIIENLRSCLEATYPGVWKLLGKECADKAARIFCFRNIPKGSMLDDYGEDFAKFLAEVDEFSELPYLHDFAKLEWIRHRVDLTESKKQQEIAIKDLNLERLDFISMQLISAMKLYETYFPLDEIDVLLNQDETKKVTLTNAKRYILIHKIDGEVKIKKISEELFYFLKQFYQEKLLLKAVENVTKAYPSFNLMDSFVFMIRNKLITSIS